MWFFDILLTLRLVKSSADFYIAKSNMGNDKRFNI